jgi:putative salt-induced outer membrane protein YdiY
MTYRSMRRTAAIVFLFLPIAFGDQIVLENGDRITGSVIKKDEKSLTFKSDVFGKITLPWEKVESLSTDKPVFVVLPGKEAVLATIEPKQDRVEVASVDTRQYCELSDLLTIRNNDEQISYERLLNPSWAQLWAGTATMGWAGARGNAKALTLNAAFNANRVTKTDKTDVHMNAIQSSALLDAETETTAQAIRGGWAYGRNIASRLTWNAFNDYEFDRFQNLDLRFVAGGGLGAVVWKEERSRFDLQMGGAYNHEMFSATADQPGFTRDSSEAYLGNEFTLKISPVTSLYQNARIFSNMNSFGEYRVNGDMGANTKLTRWLTWNASISNRYLSNPAVGRKKNDFLYTTGIGVTFSR